MSYHAYYMDSDFMIKRENIRSVLNVIQSNYPESLCDVIEKRRPFDSCDALINWFADTYGYVFLTDDCGNIADIESNDTILIDGVAEVFDKIAPFVERGSYITMCGRDDDFWWRLYFNGNGCVEYPGVMTFPDMPQGRSELIAYESENIEDLSDEDIEDDLCQDSLRSIICQHERNEQQEEA